MKRTIIPGPIAIAASVLGATEEMAKPIADAQKDVLAEAKGNGYDTRIIRKLIALRKRAPDEIAEEDALLHMYMQALGMA